MTSGDPTEQLITSWLVEEALRHLTEDHREAIVRTHLLGRPYDEVAAELGIPAGTFRSRVSTDSRPSGSRSTRWG